MTIRTQYKAFLYWGIWFAINGAMDAGLMRMVFALWESEKMDDLISRLSDLRSQYNLFDEDEQDAYHTLTEAIAVLNGVNKSAQPDIIRCKDCRWFGKAGCAIEIVDDSDKPTEDDYCSFAERRPDE